MTNLERDPRRWWVLSVLLLVVLVVLLDNTVLNVAIPSLTTELGASTSDVQWMLDSYSLVFSGLVLTAGSLCDRYGRRLALLVGVVVFGLGSLIAAFSSSPVELIGARAGMAVGAALLTPATLAIVVRMFDDAERPKAIGMWAAVSSLGIAIGPVLGGFLLEHFWWGSVFLINVPVAVVAAVAVLWLVPESRDPQGKHPDVLGAVLSVVAMVSLVWAVISGPRDGWTSPGVIAAAVISVVFFAAFIWWQRRTPYPMLDLRLFHNPMFSAAAGGSILIAFGMGGSMFLLTQHLQFVLGYGPLGAGLRLAPMAIAVLVTSSFVSARIGQRFGPGPTMTLGMVLTASGLAAIGLIAGGYLVTLVGLVLVGAGVGIAMPMSANALMSSLPPERAGIGGGVNGTLAELGNGLGVAVLGAILVAGFGSQLPAGLPSESLSAALRAAAGRTDLMGVAKTAFASGLSTSQLVGAVAVLAGGIVAGVLLLRAERAKSPAPVVAAELVKTGAERAE